jgi:hypothetical protein
MYGLHREDPTNDVFPPPTFLFFLLFFPFSFRVSLFLLFFLSSTPHTLKGCNRPAGGQKLNQK